MSNEVINPVLEMQHVEKHFGGVHAIDDFSVKIEKGKIHGLIGPNGAGKTTIFNNTTGIMHRRQVKSYSTARISQVLRRTRSHSSV